MTAMTPTTSQFTALMTCQRLAGCHSLKDATSLLQDEIAAQARGQSTPSQLRRMEVEIDSADLVRWLAAQSSGERFYFRNREGSLVVAGVGHAIAFDSGEGQSVAMDSPTKSSAPSTSGCNEPFCYHAHFFDASAVGRHAPEWSGFARSRVILPILEMRRTNECVLAVHVVGNGSAALDALEQCEPPLDHLKLPRGLQLNSDGDPVRWADGMDAALGAIATGSIEKVVLARTRGYSAIESIDPCAVLWGLMQEEPAAFHFMVEHSPGRAFVGASPERLFRRGGAFLQSEAIAGTCGRGPESASDDRLAGRLLASDKNRREHEIVIRHVESVLSPMVTTLTRDDSPSVMRLRHVQHLMTVATGTLARAIDDTTILRALHPTPAVCGWPVDASREFIQQHERMCRGLYGGVIGVNNFCFYFGKR